MFSKFGIIALFYLGLIDFLSFQIDCNWELPLQGAYQVRVHFEFSENGIYLEYLFCGLHDILNKYHKMI
jgi:hypothetical protein